MEAHELTNVLVDVIESAPDERTIKLRDEGGVILEATASEEAGVGREPSGERSHCESEEEEDSGGAREEPTSRKKELITESEAVCTRELEAELDRVIKDHQRSAERLTEEVSRLCSKVKEEKDKFGILWHLHSAQFADYDDTIVCKPCPEDKNACIRGADGGQQHRQTQSWAGTFAGKLQDRQPANIPQDWGCGMYSDRSGSLRDGGLGQGIPWHDQQPSRAEREGPPRASEEAGHSETQTVGAVAPDITTQALSRDVVVPMVRISLVTSLQVPSYRSVLAKVRTDIPYVDTDPLLLQYWQDAKESLGVQADASRGRPDSSQPRPTWQSALFQRNWIHSAPRGWTISRRSCPSGHCEPPQTLR